MKKLNRGAQSSPQVLRTRLCKSSQVAVLVPTGLTNRQGRVVRGNFYWIDVLLKDGTVRKGLTSNGEEIKGIGCGQGGGSWNHPTPFQAEEIRRPWPHTWLPSREQIVSLLKP